MRLKKIVLIGFKSFADKTVLHFDAGITCIVGPNGCGKSNIADAFRWVLGEQSAKSMRGNKMPDVIFAGTTQRKPLNIAEVSITLTDVQGYLPIEYEEITITRRLHRSGESEYLLNGNLVRLKDIQSLLLDSGMGRNAFSIFEQGKLDQVITYTPLERRHIFEEAAGILRFLQRKREALKRLEQADQNLVRVKDIHQEVEQQIQVLKEQAEKAQRFKENKELLENLEKASYVLRWNLLEKKWTEAENQLQSHQAQLADLNQELKAQQAQHQQTKHLLQQDEKTLRIKNEELFAIRSEKEIYTHEQVSSQKRLQEIQQKEKKLKRELEELNLSQQTRQQTFHDIQEKQKGVDAKFKEAEEKLSSQREKVKLKEKEIVQLRGDLQSKQQQHLKILQNESQLASECKHNETRLENNIERKGLLEERKGKGEEDLQQLAAMAKEKKQHLNQISSLVDTHKERLEQYEEELKILSRESEKKQKEIEGIHQKVIEQKARQNVLLRLREEHEGFSSGSKKLLKEAQNPLSILYNKVRPLYEFIRPSSEAAKALSVILRHYAQTLVVDSQEDFQNVLQFIQKQKIQDYSLICLEWLHESSKEVEHPFKGYVDDNLVSRHLLRWTTEAENDKEAFALLKNTLPREIWLRQEEVFLDHHQVLFNVSANESHVFMRESELKALEGEIASKEETLQEFAKQLQQLQQQKAKWQAERSELDKMLRRDEMKLVEVNFGLQRCLADQEKIKSEQAQMEKDLIALNQQIEQQQKLVQQLQDQHLIVKQELVKVGQEFDFMEKELDKQLGALRVQHQDQKEKDDTYQQLSENRKHLHHQWNVLKVQEQEYHKQEQHFLDELAEIEEIRSKIKDQEPRFQQSLEQIDQRLHTASQACAEIEQKIEAHKNTLEQMEKQMHAVLEQVHQQEGMINQLNVQAAQHRSMAQSLEHELEERYQLSIASAKELALPAKSLDHTEKQIRTIRQALQAAGDINLASIEDLEKYQERHKFLQQQLEDMGGSKDELLQIINQLDTESRTLFRQTFDAIRANFKKNFQILFNGGEADLQFTETEDILEAGIEIIAKPPGKQMRSISLLSGGEKCLTAVALLFAIFEVKSAPFCILDEIDAPLDDTNVERFTNVVKHFVDRCQFIIITHNKRTMAIGDVLFGVSMEEKGVSKLLSLEFAHSEAPEATLV